MTDSLPKVSIIIPCWNAEKYIADAIGSCLGQSYPNLEVVVVNDGSTDGSQLVLDKYVGQIVSITVKNGGSNKARNIGFEASSGELIKFLDADDYLWPGAIVRQVQHMQTLNHNEFSVGESFVYDDSKNVFRKYPDWKPIKTPADEVAQFVRIPPPITNVLYRKNILKNIGCFDIEVLVRQEVDLFLRYVFSRNMPRLFLQPIFVYRNHPTVGRVSARKLSEAYQSDLRFLQRAEKSLDEIMGIPEFSKVSEALAYRMWNMGRDMLRNEFSAEAKQCFVLAKISNPQNHVEGRIPYKIITTVVGPLMCEKIFSKIKKLLKSYIK